MGLFDKNIKQDISTSNSFKLFENKTTEDKPKEGKGLFGNIV